MYHNSIVIVWCQTDCSPLNFCVGWSLTFVSLVTIALYIFNNQSYYANYNKHISNYSFISWKFFANHLITPIKIVSTSLYILWETLNIESSTKTR